MAIAEVPVHPKREVALVGAGQVAAVHAAALARRRDVQLVAVVDPVRARAERLARSFRIPLRFARPEELLRSGLCRVAHVLVPPPLHRAIGEAVLEGGLDCLVEKPLAASAEDARALEATAARTGQVLGCHQNYLFHPAFRRLEGAVNSGRLGRVRHVAAIFHMPLRQLEAGRTEHWMFRAPLNLLLEQAVHPLSLLDALIGPLSLAAAIPGPLRPLGPGAELVASWQIALSSETATAQLAFAVGGRWPIWEMVVACSDGTARLDLVDGRLELAAPTRFHEAIDRALRAAAIGGATLGGGARELLRALRHRLGLGPRADAFFATVAGALDAFYDALPGRSAGPLSAERGRRLVELCEAIAEHAPPRPAPRPRARSPVSVRPRLLLVGGTGFIGKATAAALLARDRPVAVLARSIAEPVPPLDDPRVRAYRGDTRDAESLAAALAGIEAVVNLAHAGGAEDPEEILAAIVEGAAGLFSAARAAGVRRFVQVSSIAALWLGDPRAVITGATPVDARPGRAPYARAKALAELRLRALAEEGPPELVILRPGLVVGEGASPLHPGLGSFERPQHCVAWSRGLNPLPFVLVEDVAEAIVAALDAPGIAGRAFNLVGPIRPCARDYLAELARRGGRPIRFHPRSALERYAVELAKWVVKRASGRRVPPPRLFDLRSRGLWARFDTSDVERELGWRPTADPETFWARAFGLHGRE